MTNTPYISEFTCILYQYVSIWVILFLFFNKEWSDWTDGWVKSESNLTDPFTLACVDACLKKMVYWIVELFIIIII